MIGDRIRARRKQLGLTQEQLAAGRFDRSYISRIEANEVVPPLETLRVIAERLGKPVNYFIGDADEFTRRKIVHDYLSRAARSMKKQRHEDAINYYHVALTLLESSDDSPLLLSVYIDLAHAYAVLGRPEEGARYLYQAMNLLPRVPLASCPPDTAARLHYTRGHLAFLRNDYEEAAQAFRLADAAATREADRVRARVALGSALFRLGEYDEALQAYTYGLEMADKGIPRALVAACHHGAGVCHGALGNLDLAAYHTERALQLYQGRDAERALRASHDLGIILARKGAYRAARERLRNCLRDYKNRGRLEALASVLIDLAGIELAAGRHARALTLSRLAKRYAKRARCPRLYLSAAEKEVAALGRLDPEAARLLDCVVKDLQALSG
ncbi:MAG TPA: helix-turn-helix domain-containing protein [Thermaerobacter sp.]